MDTTTGRRELIIDANTLIDYLQTDSTILKLISTYIGPVTIPSPILDEVKLLTESDCVNLGLRVIEPSLERVIEAISKRGRLSFPDHLCLIVARANEWICVTNDVALRNACVKEGVQIYWGVEVICLLVERNALPALDAKEIISGIHQVNPRYINGTVVERAFARIDQNQSDSAD